MSPNIVVTDRPYHLRVRRRSAVFPLTAVEVRRLLDSYPVLTVKPYRLTLQGTDDIAFDVTPATLGGGEAFIKVTRT